MVVSSEQMQQQRISRRVLHPLHGVLLASTVPLFLGALLSDLAYAASYQIQWSNFASWLIVGGLIVGGLAVVWALTSIFFSHHHRDTIFRFYLFILGAMWVLGLFNSLIHARDAWAMMPTGLILSAIVFVLACASTWIGFAKCGVGGQR